MLDLFIFENVILLLYRLVEARKSAIRAYIGTRTGVFGQQTHEKNREIGNRNNIKAN